jgi:hypothetical protein
MYTPHSPILYSEDIQRSVRLRSTPKMLSHLDAFLFGTRAVRFFCGGFSSTAGYVPGNEAHALAMSGIASFWLYLSKKCCSFLSEQLERSFDPSQAKPFGFDPERNSNLFSAFAALRQCVTASACLSLNRSKTRKHFDYEDILTPVFPLSSRKYFNYCPYFTGLL